MNLAFIAFRNLLYGTGFVFFWGWVALGVRRYDESLSIDLPSSAQAFGIPIMLLGSIIALASGAAFVFVGHGTAAPFDAPRNFVSVGLYRHVRNPMYIGGFLILVGFGLFEDSISILLFCPVWLFIAHLFVVFYEEPGLVARFGESYTKYKQTVNRWVPKLTPYQNT